MVSESIYFDGCAVGTATIEKEGLFYKISCRCNLSRKEKYEIWLDDGSSKYNLGLYVPVDNGFGLVKRISGIKMNSEHVRFFVQLRKTKITVAVNSNACFQYLHRLEQARVAICDDVVYLQLD